jgi:hypothetical protein
MGVKAKITKQAFRIDDPQRKNQRDKKMFIPIREDDSVIKQKLLEKMRKI